MKLGIGVSMHQNISFMNIQKPVKSNYADFW